MSTPTLQDLLHHPRIWRGCSSATLSDQRTGFSELDRHLPGRGWPKHAMIELISSHSGIGELRLLQPVLQQVAQCWVQPPYIPYAPALSQAGIAVQKLLIIQPVNQSDSLWAINQVLRSGVYSQVLAWQDKLSMTTLRRLQLAAESGGSRLFMFRPASAVKQASPAALRLYLEPACHGLSIRILKCRGGQPGSLILPHESFMAVPAAEPLTTGRTAPRAA